MSVNFVPIVEEVQRIACKASIQIEGLTGTGKSGLALELARALAGDWSKVGAIDTENKSLNLFAGLPNTTGSKFEKFKVVQLTKDIGYKPTNYLACREALKAKGCEAIIKDSISHAWQYSGGVLDIVSQVKASGNKQYQRDSYAAWGAPEVVKEKNELLSLLRDPTVHVITTVRVKEKMEYDTDAQGKTILRSLGEQQIQQADLKYEPDLVISMISPGYNKDNVIKFPQGRIIKSRYAIFDKDEIYEFTPELLEQLRAYLSDGADPEELLELQRQEYITATKEYLDANAGARAVWAVMKQDEGLDDVKLEDIPLKTLKKMFMFLLAD